jgi:DNA-directed RNA polymerase subunit K/omega
MTTLAIPRSVRDARLARLPVRAGPRVLFIGGSMNQTTQMHQVAQAFGECDPWFTAHYASGIPQMAARSGILDFTVLGGQAKRRSEAYFARHDLQVDYEGRRNDYDLVVTSSDLVVPRNIRDRPIVLVQEGMMDPERWVYHLVRRLNLPRYLANTATTGLSHAYSVFCVASEGYLDDFVRKGVRRERMVVTGIPNFDNAAAYLDNDFPHRGYVLVATSCLRETLKYEDRRAFIRRALRIADGRPLLFKLHPNEMVHRATREIRREVADALIYSDGNTNHMIANCDALVTRYSSVVYVALALGKEVHSDMPIERLRRLMPVQNGGTAAHRIADVCRAILS